MTKNLDLDGLQSIADNYDLFYIDLWGVIHNGVKLHNSAIATLNELKKKNKSFVLLTNAPRPNTTVNKFLEKMGMNEDLTKHVYTSGEAALNFLKTSFKSKNFFHIGPPRDFDLFNEFKNNKSTELNESEYLLCTGLFDDHEDDLSYYKNLLEKHTTKKMPIMLWDFVRALQQWSPLLNRHSSERKSQRPLKLLRLSEVRPSFLQE